MSTSGNPLLDQYNRDGIVTPGLQRALDIFKQKLPTIQAPLSGGTPEAQPGGSAPPQPSPGLVPLGTPAAPRAALSTGRESVQTPNEGGPLQIGSKLPASPQANPIQTELTALTDPNSPRHKSGIEQIHNPWARNTLRVLDAIGSGFAPRLTEAIPGTQLHHRGLVAGLENQLNESQKRGTEHAQQTAQEAEVPLREAQTGEAEARTNEANANAEKLRHPQLKQEEAGKTIETDQGIMQWNPDTQRYDIKAGGAKPAKEAGTVHQLEDGTLIMAHPDGTATAITVNGQPAKGKVNTPKESPEQQFIDEYRTKNPGSSIADAETAFKKIQPPDKSDHGQNFVDPETNTLRRVEPGGAVPKGAVTPTGLSSENVPTANTRSMAEKAPRVSNFVDRINQLLDENEKQLGPLNSRWNEFTAGKVGLPNKGYTQLRTDVGLLTTALMNMHVGARGGGQIMEHFQELLKLGVQSPENLRAALGEIKTYAEEVAKEGKGASPTSTEGKTRQKYNPATGKLE